MNQYKMGIRGGCSHLEMFFFTLIYHLLHDIFVTTGVTFAVITLLVPNARLMLLLQLLQRGRFELHDRVVAIEVLSRPTG